MISLDIGPLAPSRKTVRKGIEFNIMFVGESGTGKSTLINSLFNNNSIVDREIVQNRKTVDISTTTIEIEEPGTKIKLSIIDTPGFGEFIDNDNSVLPIVNYIDTQLMSFYNDESGLNRRSIVDHRVHCCLYFVEASHRGLKPLDIKFMKLIHNKVNIFPILSKADAYTNTELIKMKQSVIFDLRENDIKVYEFPVCDEEDDPEFVRINDEFKKLIPFSVICGIDTKQTNNKETRGRSYPWGFIDIDDPASSDFTYLRSMLLRTHINDLRDITNEIHYENFRAQLITGNKNIEDFADPINATYHKTISLSKSSLDQ